MTNITKASIFAAICLTTGVSCGESVIEDGKADWPRVEVKLSAATALKDLFDAGLRPYRFPHLETNLLECKHVQIAFIQPDGQRLPSYEAELAQMHVLADGRITTLELRSHRLSVPEAKAAISRWLPLGTMPPRNATDLDHFFEKVEADYSGYDNFPADGDDRFGVVWKDNEGITYSVGFLKAMNPHQPVSLAMTIGMPRPPGIMRFSTVAIPPPPGYEDADMQAPGDFGPDNPTSEANEKAIAAAHIMPRYVDGGAAKRPAHEAPPAIAAAPAVSGNAPWWPWAVVGALVIAGLCWWQRLKCPGGGR